MEGGGMGGEGKTKIVYFDNRDILFADHMPPNGAKDVRKYKENHKNALLIVKHPCNTTKAFCLNDESYPILAPNV